MQKLPLFQGIPKVSRSRSLNRGKVPANVFPLNLDNDVRPKCCPSGLAQRVDPECVAGCSGDCGLKSIWKTK